jgi:hypothetical protein
VADVATGTEATLDGYGGGGQVYSGFGVLPAWHPGGDLVHSIVMHEHRPGFMGYRPKGERVVAFSARQVVDLANGVQAHSEAGTYMRTPTSPGAAR